MKKELIVFVALLFFSFIAFVNAQQYYDDYSDVLLVCNANSSVSQEICSYFIEKRVNLSFNISHIVNLTNVSTSETISDAEFEKIYTQVNNWLGNNSNQEINYIVTTKGVPLRTSNRAVDSKLMARLGATSNYYGKEDIFTHAVYGGYLITRLTGYNAEDAKRLVDSSTNANLTGYFLLNKYSVDYVFYDMGNTNAYNYLLSNGYSAELNNSVFVRNRNNLSGYWSWGSNAGCGINCRNSSAWNLSFNPGAIGETAVSTSARTFNLYPHDGSGPYGGQSLILDLIHYNITGIRGYVYEPYLASVVPADSIFERYLQGYNLADTYYMSSYSRDWMDVVVGDPKTHVTECSIAVSPVISLKTLLDGERISNGTDIEFDVYLSKFYDLNSLWYTIDGGLTNNTISGNSYTISTNSWDVGNYSLIVYANDTLGTVGSKTFTFIINNTLGVTPKYSSFNGNSTTNIKILEDRTNVSGLILERQGAGRIDFLNVTNVSGLDLDSIVQFSDGRKISINSSQASSLNISANVTLYNSPGNSYANQVILRDGQICNATTSPACYNFTALNASEVKFNVSSWSTYEISGNLITGCTNISQPGVYTLMNDITTNVTCLNISSNDVVLDGNGHQINSHTYNLFSAYYLISVSLVKNFTLQNIKVNVTTSWGYPFRADRVNNTNLVNNTFLLVNKPVSFRGENGYDYYNLTISNNLFNSSVAGDYPSMLELGGFYSSQSYFRNLSLTNNLFENAAYCVGISNGININVSNNSFHSYSAPFMAFDFSTDNGLLDTINIENNLAFGNFNFWGFWFADTVSNLSFKNNIINGKGFTNNDPSLRFDGNVTHAIIENNSFSDIFGSYSPIDFYSSDYVNNLTLKNNIFLNNSGSSISAWLGLNFANTAFTYNNHFAEMVVTNQTFLNYPTITSNLSFPGNINLSSNYIYVNSTALPELNGSANLTFYFSSNNFSKPYIAKDSVACSDCINFTPLTADTVEFNVSSFSAYSLVENDTTSPNVILISNLVTNQSSLISFNVSDDGRLKNCTFVVGGLSNYTENFSNPNSLLISGLNAGISYTGTLSCYDYAENVNTTSFSFTASENPSSNSGSGGISQLIVSDESIANGEIQSLLFGTKLIFNFKTENHTILLKSINRSSSEVLIEVYSEKQAISLSVNETKEVDLDNDGKADVRISLLKIYDNLVKVDLKIEEIKEVVVDEKDEPIVDKIVDSVKENDKTWMSFVVVLLIILAILAIIYWKRRK